MTAPAAPASKVAITHKDVRKVLDAVNSWVSVVARTSILLMLLVLTVSWAFGWTAPYISARDPVQLAYAAGVLWLLGGK